MRLKTDAQRRAQLYGMMQAAGTLKLGRERGIEYVTESREAAEHGAKLAEQLYHMDTVLISRTLARRKNPLIVALFSGEQTEQLLLDAGLMTQTAEGMVFDRRIPVDKTSSPVEQRAFLRGMFLGAGSISDPLRAYHMEIVCRNEPLSCCAAELLCGFGCNAKSVRRKEKYVVYLKDGDSIAVFLALLGASVATMEFESVRAARETNNYLNRASNCDNANITKTVTAAEVQVAAIKTILENPQLNKRLSPILREAAELRLHYPELSLAELSDIAGVGRSGMNHRLQRIINIVQETD